MHSSLLCSAALLHPTAVKGVCQRENRCNMSDDRPRTLRISKMQADALPPAASSAPEANSRRVGDNRSAPPPPPAAARLADVMATVR